MNKGEKTLREIVYEEILKIMVEKGYNFQQELTKEEEKKVKEKALKRFKETLKEEK